MELAKDPCVFVVDGDTQFLDSLVILLKAHEFLVRGFDSPEGFLHYYRAGMPGCLVVDARMPRQSGLQLYERLLREGKRLPVIFITAQADVPTAVSAMKCGAIEFLEKPFERETFINSIQKALELDAESRWKDAQYAAIADRMGRLSDREWETLSLIQAGESNKSMAARLFLTERAIEMRRSAIMKKLQVSSVAELLDLATTHRILTEQRRSIDK